MGHKLRSISMDGRYRLSERACENYICRSCGEGMISVNFVNGICIQVFVSHGEGCTCFIGNAFRRTVAVTCETCRYSEEGGCRCTYDGPGKKNIAGVRTSASEKVIV